MVATRGDGTPILMRDVARVAFGPDMRRGLAEWNGDGEVVGGIVVVRYQEDVLRVIERVKAKIEEVRGSLPEGVEIELAYDRTDLIRESVETLAQKLLDGDEFANTREPEGEDVEALGLSRAAAPAVSRGFPCASPGTDGAASAGPPGAR